MPEEIMVHLLPTTLEYLNMYLLQQSSSILQQPVGQCEQHMAVMWAVAFFLLENFEHEIQVKQETKFANSCFSGAMRSNLGFRVVKCEEYGRDVKVIVLPLRTMCFLGFLQQF